METLRTVTNLIPSARKEGDTILMAVNGELDLHNSPEFRTQVLDFVRKNHPKRVVFDMQAVPYMDSSALAVLVETLKTVMKTNGKVCLVGLQPRVKGLLEIARLSTIFYICADEAEALSK
jgi:anti-anti-sigma factor